MTDSTAATAWIASTAAWARHPRQRVWSTTSGMDGADSIDAGAGYDMIEAG